MKSLAKMFHPFEHRGHKFKNRFGMAAMTRCRADPDGTPNDLVKEYYRQRSEQIGFISTEAMGVLPNCNPWGASCNVLTAKSVEKWKEIVAEVHKNGTVFFAQLVHGGRSVHPDFNNGIQPFGPSPIAIKDQCHTPNGKKPHVEPREMTQDDIEAVKKGYLASIKNAIAAGFDGIEFHGANGYLIDQFLRSGSNQRKDKYGGSIENRCRFLLELVDLALQHIPPEKVGLKISVVGRYQDMYEAEPEKLAAHLLKELSARRILYVVMGCPEPYLDGIKQLANPVALARKHFNGLVIGDGNCELDERIRRVNDGEADIANFGQLMWANPDLPDRLKNGWPLNQPDFKYIYSGGANSYTDIPKYDPSQAKKE